MDALESFINSSIGEEYTDFNEEDMSGLGEEEMDELNIADYADLDEEAIDDSMFDFKPDYVSPSLGDDDMEDEDMSDENMKDEDMVDEVEIDLDEIKNEINNNIHTTLSKYFK